MSSQIFLEPAGRVVLLTQDPALAMCVNIIGSGNSALLTTIYITATFLSIIIYRVFLDRLSHIPGPLLWRISRLPYAYNLFCGRLPYAIAAIHDRYGPVVRSAPNEVSFTTPSAWGDIYKSRAHNNGKKLQMQKDPLLFLRPKDGSKDILFAYDDKEHARHRYRILPFLLRFSS